MRFEKGKSGNPSGRPKDLIDIKAIARAQTTRNLEVLMELRDQDGDMNVRLKATVALHEIGWGKPGQSVTADVNHSGSVSLLDAIRGK